DRTRRLDLVERECRSGGSLLLGCYAGDAEAVKGKVHDCELALWSRRAPGLRPSAVNDQDDEALIWIVIAHRRSDLRVAKTIGRGAVRGRIGRRMTQLRLHLAIVEHLFRVALRIFFRGHFLCGL